MRAPPHRRFRRAISGYADGELDAPIARALAIHLLECHACSRDLAVVHAIKGSLRRLADAEPPTLAATRLRRWAAIPQAIGGVPPLELRDPVGAAVGRTSARPAGAPRPVGLTGRHRMRKRVGALVGIVAATATTGALLLHRQGPSPDPGTVAALVELARFEPAAPQVAGSGEPAGRPPGHMLELGNQTVALARYLVDGREVLVATSDRAFAMPVDARPLGREPDAPWLARRGDLGIACLSRPTHRLIVGPLAAERLVEIGRRGPARQEPPDG